MTRVAILAVLFLSGCGKYYVHADKERAFEPDFYECEKDAAPVNSPGRRSDMMDRCMRLKGWERTHPGPLERLNMRRAPTP